MAKGGEGVGVDPIFDGFGPERMADKASLKGPAVRVLAILDIAIDIVRRMAVIICKGRRTSCASQPGGQRRGWRRFGGFAHELRPDAPEKTLS